MESKRSAEEFEELIFIFLTFLDCIFFIQVTSKGEG